MRSNIEDAIISHSLLTKGLRLGVEVQTLTGTYALGADCNPVQALDPGGAGRTVKLPPSPQRGDIVIIINTADAAEVITVQDADGNGLTPAITPTQNETAICIYTGTAWRGLVAIGV